jgi:hypothetical protein
MQKIKFDLAITLINVEVTSRQVMQSIVGVTRDRYRPKGNGQLSMINEQTGLLLVKQLKEFFFLVRRYLKFLIVLHRYISTFSFGVADHIVGINEV